VIIILGFIPVVNIFSTAVLWIIGFIYWVIFLIQSLQGTGQRIQAPLIGGFVSPYVDQIANAVK